MANELITILEQIDTVFKNIQSHRHDATLLLQDANSLSTLTYNLGKLYIDAKEQATDAEARYKDMVDDEYIELLKEDGMTQGKAEILAKRDCREQRDEMLKYQRLTNKLQIYRRDVETKISILQSYASELRSQYNRKEL